MIALAKRLVEWLQEGEKTPRATFEIVGISEDNRIKINFTWNSAFIKHINALGFQAETEEDSVQLFFYTSQMRPTSLNGDDEAIQSEAHPSLSSIENEFKV